MVRRIAMRRPVTFVKTMMTGKATDSPERTPAPPRTAAETLD
jgi:hypothetical protein